MMEDVITSILSFKVGGDDTFDAPNYIQYFDKISKCFEKFADPELRKFCILYYSSFAQSYYKGEC